VVLFFLLQTHCMSSLLGLRIEDVSFPSHVMLGQTVTLTCEYSLGPTEQFDSIKWYKDNQEFYRIVHNQNNYINPDRVVTFDRPGIHLNKEKSGIVRVGVHQLVLQDVTLKSSGDYRCQITLSGPPFHTEQRDRNLTVIIRPEGGPEIIGLRPIYTNDESIEVICTSKRSYPAAKLDFLINDEPASDELVVRYPVAVGEKGILQTSRIRLTYHLSPRSGGSGSGFGQLPGSGVRTDEYGFGGGGGTSSRFRSNSNADVQLRLKCTAKIGNGYWKSAEKHTILRHKERLLESRSSASTGVPSVFSIKMVLLVLLHGFLLLKGRPIQC